MSKKLVRSPLNHLGNKFRMIDLLLKEFPNEEYILIDVFGGSGLVGVNSFYKNIIYNEKDNVLFLINKLFYKEKLEKIIENIEFIIKKNNLKARDKDSFLKFRNNFNQRSEKNIYELLVLIFFGFNSQIRFNSKNEFNIPVGKSSFSEYRKNNLINFSLQMKEKKFEFYNLDFESFVKEMLLKFENKKILFYLDPPYFSSKATYNNNWSNEDDKRLNNIIQLINDKQHKFVLSNFVEYENNINNELLKIVDKNSWYIKNVDINYKNSNYQRRTKLTKEVIIKNF